MLRDKTIVRSMLALSPPAENIIFVRKTIVAVRGAYVSGYFCSARDEARARNSFVQYTRDPRQYDSGYDRTCVLLFSIPLFLPIGTGVAHNGRGPTEEPTMYVPQYKTI